MPSVIATADALAYMHSVGVLHLDIKADNVLVIDPEAGDIRCIDFESATDEIGVKSPVLGCTRPYVSPEYYLGYSPTKSVDVYAFGISMYGSLGNTGLPKRQDTRISTSFRQLDYKRVIAHLGDQTYAESLGFVTPRMVREKFGSNRALRKTITSCIDVNHSNRTKMNEVSLDLATI